MLSTENLTNSMKLELINFIASRTNLKVDEIKPELKLAKDIGFYGLDAISFFEEYFEQFEIQNLENFDVDLHIDGSIDFAPRPLSWLKSILIKDRRKYLCKDVTMGHLDKIIDTRKWINEI